MKLILIKKVENLGNVSDIVNVKDGYGRNFLIPKNFAVLPNNPLANGIIAQKNSAKEEVNTQQENLKKLAKSVSGKTFKIEAKADKAGKLYGSVTPHQISLSTGIPEKYISAHYKKTGTNELKIDIVGNIVNLKIEIVKKE